jgi:hypothetical protein
MPEHVNFAETTVDELYDFSEWEPSEPPQHPKEWVRENLRIAFKEFGDGYWTLWSNDEPAFGDPVLKWKVQDWDTAPASIRLGPDDLKDLLIEEINDQFSPDGQPRFEEQREGVRDVLNIINAWRLALEAAEAQANEMLSRPIAG